MPRRESKIGMVPADKAEDHLPNKNQKNSEEKTLSKENNKEIKFLSKKRNRLGLYFKTIKGKMIYKCPYENCNRFFKEKGNLKTHIRIHTGVRPYICHFENCNKSFITIGNLKSHICKHTGIKPYKCKYEGCKKSYSRLCRYKIHLRTHIGLKPYKCSFPDCDKSFNEKGNLKIHHRIHTGEKPYSCNFEGCNRTFKAHGHLKDHIRRHLNIKPFACDQCEMRFTRNSTLKIHKYVHSGEKPYKCEFPGCSKSFAERGNLRAHQKVHLKTPKSSKKGKVNSTTDKKLVLELSQVPLDQKNSNISLYSLTQINITETKENSISQKINKTIKQKKSFHDANKLNGENSDLNKESTPQLNHDLANNCLKKFIDNKEIANSNLIRFESENNINNNLIDNNHKDYDCQNNINSDIIINNSNTKNELNPILLSSPLNIKSDSKKEFYINNENEEPLINKEFSKEFIGLSVPYNKGSSANTKSKFEKNLEFYTNYIKNHGIVNTKGVIDHLKNENNLNDKINLNTNNPIFLNVYCYNNFNFVNDLKKTHFGINHRNAVTDRTRSFVNKLGLNENVKNNFNNADYFLNQDFFMNNINNNDLYFDYLKSSFLNKISKMNYENLFFQKLFKEGN